MMLTARTPLPSPQLVDNRTKLLRHSDIDIKDDNRAVNIGSVPICNVVDRTLILPALVCHICGHGFEPGTTSGNVVTQQKERFAHHYNIDHLGLLCVLHDHHYPSTISYAYMSMCMRIIERLISHVDHAVLYVVIMIH
jgi:hypothetical protein